MASIDSRIERTRAGSLTAQAISAPGPSERKGDALAVLGEIRQSVLSERSTAAG